MTLPPDAPTWPPQPNDAATTPAGVRRPSALWGRLRTMWHMGVWQKIALLAPIPFLCVCLCCSSSMIFAATPYGQQLARETRATETAQAIYYANAHATATAYAFAHPKPTATPKPTSTAGVSATATGTPTPTAEATATPLPPTATATSVPPTSAPTAPPPPPSPTATPAPSCAGVNGNPWCYDFNPGNLIYSPPGAFCSYFSCINNFWNGTGYVVECQDGMYSKSGGHQGVCSYHGGYLQTLYSH